MPTPARGWISATCAPSKRRPPSTRPLPVAPTHVSITDAEPAAVVVHDEVDVVGADARAAGRRAACRAGSPTGRRAAPPARSRRRRRGSRSPSDRGRGRGCRRGRGSASPRAGRRGPRSRAAPRARSCRRGRRRRPRRRAGPGRGARPARRGRSTHEREHDRESDEDDERCRAGSARHARTPRDPVGRAAGGRRDATGPVAGERARPAGYRGWCRSPEHREITASHGRAVGRAPRGGAGADLTVSRRPPVPSGRSRPHRSEESDDRSARGPLARRTPRFHACLARRAPAERVDGGASTATTPTRSPALRAALDYDEWCIQLGEAGLATPTWPAEYGAGLSLSPGEAKHVNDVLGHYKIPRPYNIIGIGMGGPTVMAWGTEEMKHRLLKPLACNQEIWCQLFSEPGAGSDVAGLATRAVRDGDEWVVNGQKVWTTVAHISRWGMLLCRTNPEVPKHTGPVVLRGRHAPARRRGPAAGADHRRRRVQRGVLQRRQGAPRLDARSGGRRVEGRHHHPDERAGVALGRGLDRRRRRRRQPGRPPAREGEGHDRPDPAPAARAGLHREPADPAQQRAGRGEAQERWRGRARGLDHQAHAGRVQPAAPEPRDGDRGRRRHRVGGQGAVEDAAHRARDAGRRRGAHRRPGSCGRRPTRSRAGPPT